MSMIICHIVIHCYTQFSQTRYQQVSGHASTIAYTSASGTRTSTTATSRTHKAAASLTATRHSRR